MLTTQPPASSIRGIADLIARPSFEVELERLSKLLSVSSLPSTDVDRKKRLTACVVP